MRAPDISEPERAQINEQAFMPALDALKKRRGI